jgi:prevent-host-death family protein
MNQIGIRELKAHTGEILRRVRENGEIIEVSYHGRTIARIVPARPVSRSVATPNPVWSDLDRLAAEIAAKWPEGLSAAEAVKEGRREL